MKHVRKLRLLRLVAAGIISMLLLGVVPVFAQSENPPSPVSALQPTPVSLDFPETPETPEPAALPVFYEIPLARSMHDHFYFIRPLDLQEITWPTSDFRFGYYDTKTNSMHTGLDIVAPLGQTVRAVADGEVIFSGYGLINGEGDKTDPYGIAVVIRHAFSFEGKTLYTVYGHFSEALVSAGQKVRAGDPIGLVGLTGNTTGPHLHLEVRIHENGEYKIQNPELWLVPPVDHGVLAGQIKGNNGVFLNSKILWLKSLDNDNSWTITTYSQGPIDRHLHDAYFQENFVQNDIPAGSYEISTSYNYKIYKTTIQIVPGAVNYITFNGKPGFTEGYPANSSADDFLR